MKNIIRHTLFIISLVLMTSCTLNMDEYIVPEDQKGKDEPYTEVSSYGEVTYQYHDNVISLNGEPQEYVAMTNDSVIWFMDNIPDKWVPQEGNFIAANCSETFPLGICAKVRSIIREGGMIRVEHEVADKNDIFKSLEMRLDFEYIMPGQSDFEDDSIGESRATIKRKGFWLDDTKFVDMSLYDTQVARDKPKDTETDTTDFQFNKAFDLKSGRQIYLSLSYQSIEVVTVHQYEDLVNDYKEEWNDTYTERNVNLLVGYGNNPENATRGLASFPKSVDDIRGIKDALHEIRQGMSKRHYVKTINPVVSLPSFPFGVMFRFDVSLGYTIMGYGNLEANYRSETHRVGYIYDRGNKREIDRDISNPQKEPYFKFSKINFGGSADLWLRGRVGAGILVGSQAGGVGGVLGIEGKVGFRASLETESLTDLMVVDRQNFNAGFYASFSGFGEGLVKVGPWTGSLGDFNFNTVEKTAMLNLKAEVNDKKTKSKLEVVEKEYILEDEKGNPIIDPVTGGLIMDTRNELTINTSLTFSKLETFFLFPHFNTANQRPALRIYEGEIKSGSGKYKQVIIDEVLKANKTYDFSTNLNKAGLDEMVGIYEVVPCIYDTDSKFVTEYRNNTMIVTPGVPTITQPKCYQWYGRELSEEDWEYYLEEYGEAYFKGKKRTDFASYGFTTVVELKNSTRIKEWGIKFRLENPDGKAILNREFPIKFDGLCPAGKYTIITTFISEYKPKEPDSGIDALSITAQPYCSYDGDKKFFSRSKYINFYYPYERDGGPYVVGKSEFQDF
ncbi:MAG: hypothetical protein E7080_04940 [Bacteroidales bacterium]|nr:hypothetical protein [Bacteroidales bacterium]